MAISDDHDWLIVSIIPDAPFLGRPAHVSWYRRLEKKKISDHGQKKLSLAMIDDMTSNKICEYLVQFELI